MWVIEAMGVNGVVVVVVKPSVLGSNSNTNRKTRCVSEIGRAHV